MKDTASTKHMSNKEKRKQRTRGCLHIWRVHFNKRRERSWCIKLMEPTSALWWTSRWMRSQGRLSRRIWIHQQPWARLLLLQAGIFKNAKSRSKIGLAKSRTSWGLKRKGSQQLLVLHRYHLSQEMKQINSSSWCGWNWGCPSSLISIRKVSR